MIANNRVTAGGMSSIVISLLASSALMTGCPPTAAPQADTLTSASLQPSGAGPAGPQGEPGATGPAGPSGDLRIYGDGSALDRTVSAAESLADSNLQFANFTVASGVVLTVPSGTIIRCTGTFTNDGIITVQSFARGGFGAGDDATDLGAVAPPSSGISARAAGQGEFGDNSGLRNGGAGGIGLSESEARWVLNPGLLGGGGGAASDDSGAPGGGTFIILARGGIVNNGTINADGFSALNAGSGGGGGGIIILASHTEVANNGTLTARGGNGENADTNEAPSGGGGGGIIHLAAPAIPALGTRTVTGGTGGGGAGGSTTISPRRAGAGGGACAGNGGNGGDINVTNLVGAATAGESGFLFITTGDPTPLF